ncbi:mannose-6-phosphate isomerase [Spinactinospora alkalitolerans]|uniref:mannose-6-phosphate isomerase n=1 Tax=Spinactinospora alkalitolerans TaxID=687207 RepID=A0A852TUN1_9ACTN|nr:mannose-6-phosphate isomerase, class I [Spinactinospora alkalitolerans]NYE46493.1 mannose-6-phosphate isomerase [Spinactinospora alkalitolerans]
MRRLINQVRPYAWGSTTAIPRLLGREPDGTPQAELWLGAHPGAPSRLVTEDGEVPFCDVIAADPKDALGERTVTRFGERLPFLLKVLAAEAPLSLQVHPDAARARAGHAAEEAAGIAVDAPDRNYRDPHHKPELVLALEPFEALCGFRDPAEARADLEGFGCDLAEALRADLAARDRRAALRAAMTRLLTLSGRDRDALVADLVAEFAARLESGDPAGPHAATVVELAGRYPGDPGAAAALLLNRITLRPGEALFLPAGNVHAYLRGTAVEIMAGSDNVLRAGLTAKHVDSAELLAVVDFAVLPIPYARPVAEDGRLDFRPGVADFALSVIGPGGAAAHLPGGAPTIVLALEGSAVLRTDSGGELVLRRGESAFVSAADGPVAVEGDAHLVAATTGGCW